MGSLLILGGLLLAAYLISCLVYPYARCPLPWCRSKQTKGDSKGHYRYRRPCPLHPTGRDYRRLGARLMGRG